MSESLYERLLHCTKSSYAYDLANLRAGPIWQRPVGVIVGMMPAYDPRGAGTLFFADGQGRIHAVDPATGQDRWVSAAFPAIHGHMAIANDLIYLNASDQGMVVLDEQTGQTVTMLVPAHKGASSSGPVISQGVLYWLSGAYLNAWGLPD